MTGISRGFTWIAVVVFSAVFTVWLTFWDVILYYAGAVPGDPMSSPFMPIYFGVVGGSLPFLLVVQLLRHGVEFIFRWQTYAGLFLIFVGALPITMFTYHASVGGVALPLEVWLIVIVLTAAKLAIWWFWYRLFILKELMPTDMPEAR